MEKTLNGFRKIVEGVAGAALLLMAVIVVVQVFCRFVLNDSLSWSEEAARYLQVWITFVGSAVALRRGAHIGVDFVTSFFKGKGKWLSDLFIHLVVAVFCVIVIVAGFQVVMNQMRYGQTSPALHLAMWKVYLALPIGGILMLIEDVAKIVHTIRSFPKKQEEQKNHWPYGGEKGEVKG